MATAKMIRNANVWKRFDSLPAALTEKVGAQLAIEVEDLVMAIQRAAPVSVELEKHPGALRDSVHDYANPERPMSYRVIADAKDDHGAFIGQHVEFGHLATNGKPVPASPFFFPTYRARKKGMKKRLMTTARQVIKSQLPETSGGN